VSEIRDIVINIVAAILMFVAGMISRGVVGFAQLHRDRAFWGRRLLRGRTYLFIGSFVRFNHLEPSGFVGLGDLRALQDVTATLEKNRAKFEVAYSSRIQETQLRDNIVLLGLDETNSLAVGMLERLGSGFQVDTNAMTITDSATGKTYSPEWEVDPLNGDGPYRDFDGSWFISVKDDGFRQALRFRADYGVLVRSENPFAPNKTLVMMAGIYGFGSWRAAQLPKDKDFQRRCAGLNSFECLFRVEVQQNQLLTTSILVIRGLPRRSEMRSPLVSTDHSGETHCELQLPCGLADSPPYAKPADES
jgi:hypothetical protein